MASHTPRFESPAKVFAKLKSKVQREEMCANDGLFTGKDPLCNVRAKLGEYTSPRKRAESTWMNEVLKENQRFGSYRNEAQPLTLSPISSPQKTFGYLYSNICSSRLEEMPPVTATAHGRTLTSGAFLESTAVSQPLFLAKKQNHTEPPHIRDLDGYNVTCRTPAKTQPVENDCVGGVFQEKRAPLMSSANKRLPIRKRKWEPWGFNNVSSDGVSEPRERKTSFSEDDTQNNTRMEDLGQARGFSADPSDLNQFTHDPMCPPQRSTAKKRCIFMDKVPPMSPAKMFAYMKERESKTEQKEAHKVSSSTTELIDGGPSRPPRDIPSPSTHSMGETEDTTTEGVPDSVPSASPSRVESADSQLDEDALIPTASSQPVLLEDPLVLNTPRVSIPKKQEAAFKRNKWPQCAKFPSESVIHLQKWYLRRNHMGLFVDGIHQERNIPWNSNIIVERLSNNVVKTVSGRVYILVGKMNLCVDSVFPKWLLKKFAAGFPPDWKALYEKSLSETKDDPGGKTVNSERRGIGARTKSEASSNNLSVKQNKQKAFKTPESCPPASSSSAKVSRSGRIIKPPLEYWKGGRVTLDAHMNVTIHECYDTSICNPEVTTTVSARWSQKPARVFPLSNGGPKQCESASDQDVAVPLRRVKAPLRKRNRARANLSEKPSPVESLTSSEERPGRRTRSSERLSNRALYAASLSQKQSEPEKPSRQRSKKQTHNTTRPSVRSSTRAVPASSKSPTVSDETSQDQDDFSIRKYKHKKRDKKSQPGQTSSSNEAEDSGMELRKRSRGAKNKEAPPTQRKHKQSKCTKTLRPAEPLPKSTQSSKKHKAHKRNTQIPQEQDEDEWTEAELLKLQEAVSFYPKHVAGYWAKVARIVGTRSAEECHKQHTSQGTSQTPAKRARESKKKKVEVPKDSVTAQPVISARAGTLKRKQQVRQFLENMPRDDVEDVFRSAYMQSKRFEIPSMCPSEDQDFTLTDLEPLTPMSTGFPEVKTPQCLHITPGMMGSPMRSNDDKYVFQLQKRMKKHRFNVCKKAPSKSFTPTPSVKRTMRRCGNTENDTFVVWEMFPGNDAASESGEEEDFYFSDDD